MAGRVLTPLEYTMQEPRGVFCRGVVDGAVGNLPPVPLRGVRECSRALVAQAVRPRSTGPKHVARGLSRIYANVPNAPRPVASVVQRPSERQGSGVVGAEEQERHPGGGLRAEREVESPVRSEKTPGCASGIFPDVLPERSSDGG